MPTRRLFGLLLTFLLGAVSNVHAQQIPDSYSIRGHIIVPAKNHRDNFEVLLKTKDGEQIIAFTNVDIAGQYVFINLTSGYYDVVVHLPGYREAREHVRLGVRESLMESGTFVLIAEGTLRVRPPYDLNIILSRNPDEDSGEDEEPVYSKKILEDYASGLQAISNGHPDVAAKTLERVVKAVPDFYDAHFNLGLVYQDLERRSEAEKEFLKAHDLNPDSAACLMALGRLLVEESDIRILAGEKMELVRPSLNRASENLSQALILDPKLATGFYYLGAIDFRTASYPAAERELKRALTLDPKLAAARITLINVYVQQKSWQNALENLDTFLLENPTSPYRQQVTATRLSVARRLQLLEQQPDSR